jgi:hypothetical protein
MNPHELAEQLDQLSSHLRSDRAGVINWQAILAIITQILAAIGPLLKPAPTPTPTPGPTPVS